MLDEVYNMYMVESIPDDDNTLLNHRARVDRVTLLYVLYEINKPEHLQIYIFFFYPNIPSKL